MRRYETIVIIDPDILEKERDEFFAKVQKIIENKGGKIIELDKWGNKKLAYLVKKKQTGYYLRIDYYCDNNEVIKDLEINFKHDEKALKFITVLLEKKFDPDTLKNKKGSIETKKTEVVEETKIQEEETKEEN